MESSRLCDQCDHRSITYTVKLILRKVCLVVLVRYFSSIKLVEYQSLLHVLCIDVTNACGKIDSFLVFFYMQGYPSYLHELEMMQQGGIRCEIEALYVNGYDFLTTFVTSKLICSDYI